MQVKHHASCVRHAASDFDVPKQTSATITTMGSAISNPDLDKVPTHSPAVLTYGPGLPNHGCRCLSHCVDRNV